MPIVEFPGVGLDAAQGKRIAAIAKRMLANEPMLASTQMFGDKVSTGVDDAPALFFEDHAEIALYSQPGGDLALQYRILMLAGDGDMVLISGPRSEDFEAYCRHTLGLGGVTVLGVPSSSALGVCRTMDLLGSGFLESRIFRGHWRGSHQRFASITRPRCAPPPPWRRYWCVTLGFYVKPVTLPPTRASASD
ncbi:hypothetical protein ABZN20_08115 [Methylococcus sp. ANG]|uniref:hypothetical protein n=1 Tax=Methylococcus sp. ANG TaxID=3231903 RepID=UPI00345A75C6